ncbi:MAG: hypothetical protein N2044_10175, partial [Cyclobacteriaceae bacterium]|nr:hypothetical protein [Cyclobacteriaceae bacterium]
MRHLYLLIFLFMIAACSGSGNKQEKKTEEPFQYLYDKVMDIHDEVMPRMDEIQKIKRQLQEKLKNSKDLAEEKRKELEQKIALLDSASRAMMNWMHEYHPEYYEGDSLRIYLENEVERVTRVKELMLDAIKKGSEDG